MRVPSRIFPSLRNLKTLPSLLETELILRQFRNINNL
jgi:hypothetical protein